MTSVKIQRKRARSMRRTNVLLTDPGQTIASTSDSDSALGEDAVSVAAISRLGERFYLRRKYRQIESVPQPQDDSITNDGEDPVETVAPTADDAGTLADDEANDDEEEDDDDVDYVPPHGDDDNGGGNIDEEGVLYSLPVMFVIDDTEEDSGNENDDVSAFLDRGDGSHNE